MTDSQLAEFVVALGQPKFRAAQIRDWLARGAPDAESMKNLPATLRAQLDAVAQTLPLKVEKILESSDGQTVKFLLAVSRKPQVVSNETNVTHDSRLTTYDFIETVLMQTTYGNSVCVSSQVGCAMGCKFCASTLLGLRRDLTADEMLAQVLIADWWLKRSPVASRQSPVKRAAGALPKTKSARTDDWRLATGDSVTHIVVMGVGEPLQNTGALFEFLERANRDLDISYRRMTVSTCGIVPGIRALKQWGKPINLAISLHAPNDSLRTRIMPIAEKYKIAEILDVAFDTCESTGRQLMIEYIMLGGINDSPESAHELAALLHGKNCMVNLIPWNPVSERDFTAPSNNTVHRFQDILIENGIHTRIRRERGQDIGSACGQLRIGHKQ